MNFEERVESTQPSLHSSQTNTREQDQSSTVTDKRGDSLSSVPSDADWVSPFTLPPLPALRRGRDQVNLLRSPEPTRQRGGSGAYYAAAWGSPYASPSPESASRRLRDRRRSNDSDFQSQPQYGHSPLARGSSRVRHSLERGDSPEPRPLPGRAKSERPNWLSDSDDSDNDKRRHRDHTPRPSAEIGSWGPSPARTPFDRSSPRSHQTHETQESTDTVTPETFRAGRLPQSSKSATLHKMAQIEEPTSDMSPDKENFKALPGLPKQTTSQSLATSKLEGPSSPLRPRLGSLTSPQRQRKKVNWKGKSCIISLPMTDRESAGLPPILSPQDVRDKLDALRLQGYSTQGFELTDIDGVSATFGNGQSCDPYPNPTEVFSERQMKSFKVYIPDQSEWQRWVEYLQEEKLRALGVTSSDSEPVQSGPSPLSASLSRTSSRFPGAPSPPVGTSSAASNSARVTSNPFSPPFSVSSGRASAIGSGASSQMNGYPAAMHGYKGSIAFPISHGRMASPVEFVPGQTSPFIPGGRPPLNSHLRRPTGFSPINTLGIQSLDQVLSPLNGPSSGQQPSTQSQSSSYFAPTQLSQSAPRGHDMGGNTLSPPATSLTSVSAPRTPSFMPRSGPETQHPTPRSHKHNLSAALQKEIDDAEAALEEQDREGLTFRNSARDSKGDGKSDSKSAQIEDDHDDPPILRRPETIAGMDDQSDIVTNPSLAGTPALLSDSNPFNNWQSLSDAARGDRNPVNKPHQAKSSQPKLNVEAKEFDPGAGFKSSNFNFGSSTGITPFAASFKPSVPAFKPGHAAKPSLSRFNVEAPAFVPGRAAEAVEQHFNKTFAPEQSSFAFSSASFNVDAPVFNPSGSLTKEPKVLSESESASDLPKTSIFGKINIEPGTLATRRSKALPIIRPRSKDGPQRSVSSASEDEESVEDDEDGRAPVPTDRAKRARTVDSDGDRSPVYADSAPFIGNSRILSEIVDETSARAATPEKSREKPVDGWSYIPAEPELMNDGKSPVVSQGGSNSGRASPFEFSDTQDATKFNEARPRSPASVSDVDAPEDLALSPVRESTPSPLPAQHKSRFSLSALAKPFEFKPNQSRPAQWTPSPPPNELEKAAPATANSSKPRGLMASRFASSPPPEPSLPPLDAREQLSSPGISDLPLPTPMNEKVARDVKVSQNVDDTATSEFEEQPADSGPAHSATNSQQALSQGHVSEASPVVGLEHNRLASLASSRYAPQGLQNLSLSSSRYDLQHDSTSLASPAYIPGRKELPKVEFSDNGDDLMPSFEEIDAVMKQFENNPELGIERNDSPVQSTPLVDMHLGNNFRSDAPSPSPSPRRIDRHIEPTEAASAASFGLGLGIHRLNTAKEEVSDWNDAMSSTEEHKLQARAQFFDGHVNDLVDGILENRLGPVERSLQTIQHSLALLATRPTSKRKSTSSDIRESDADDEDEYNAYEGFSSYRSRSPDAKRNRHTSRVRAAVAEGLAQFRESMPPPTATALDLSELRDELAELRELVRKQPDDTYLQTALSEMRQLLEKNSSHLQQQGLKRTLHDVISSHPRLIGSRAEHDHGSSAGNLKLQLDGLEAMLKVEQERAEHEARLRKQREDEMQELRRKLHEAEDEAAGQREATEMAEQNLQAFVQEKEAYQASEREVEKLNMIIDEQEENLNEYRRYKEERQGDMERLRNENNDLADDLEAARAKAKDLSFDLEDERNKVRDLTADLEDEHAKNKELTRTLWDVKDQLEERTKTSRSLQSRTDQLRHEVANAVRELGTEQAEWRQREHELLTKMTIIEGALDSATRRQEKAEVDHDYVAKQLKDALAFKDRFESLQQEKLKLQEELSNSRANQVKHEDDAYRLERELHNVKKSKAADIAAATARLQAEVDGARSQLEGLRSDSEARIARLQARLDTAEIDVEDHKAKFDAAMSEAEEARKQALQEQNEKHEASLEEQRSSHDRHLADLRDRHTRAMHNSSDDRHRMEHHYNEKIALGEDKLQHLESKVADLEERLHVSKSAARAAVEAAMAKGANLPTPAPSVVASPPQRAQSASLSMVKGTDIPEKISVQSLRETILNLTEQVSERQQKVESLEAELAKVDKGLPSKIKAYETEAGWLRELLSVRIDEIEDIIQSIGKPDFDRDSVKDAAIRLKTNIQMEQQIRERAANNAGIVPALPSLSSLASYAQSPRTALPMVATAAWGNFRKARDVSINTLGQLANDYVATPSKSTRAISPAGSWSSGIMTPPGTVQQSGRTPSTSNASTTYPPPAMRPLAAAAAARKMSSPATKSNPGATEARPLRAFGTQPRALRTKLDIAAVKDASTENNENSSPRTPTMLRGGAEMDLGDDIDDDASPLDARGELRPFDDLPPQPVEARADDAA